MVPHESQATGVTFETALDAAPETGLETVPEAVLTAGPGGTGWGAGASTVGVASRAMVVDRSGACGRGVGRARGLMRPAWSSEVPSNGARASAGVRVLQQCRGSPIPPGGEPGSRVLQQCRGSPVPHGAGSGEPAGG